MINRIHIMGGKFLIMTAQHLAGINLPCIITSPFPTSTNLQVLNNIYVADTLWKAIQLELHTSVMMGWDPRGLFPRQCTGFSIPNAKSFLPPGMSFAASILPLDQIWQSSGKCYFRQTIAKEAHLNEYVWWSLLSHRCPGSFCGVVRSRARPFLLSNTMMEEKVPSDRATWGTSTFF